MRGLLLLLFLSAGTLSAQTMMPMEVLKKYEERKLDKGVALAISLALPGGGMIYSGNEAGGIAVLGASVGASVWLYNSVRTGDEIAFPLLTVFLLRVADVGLAFNWIDAHNSDLLNRLSLNLGAKGVGIAFHL